MLNGVPLYITVPVVLIIGVALALVAKTILGSRARLSGTASVIAGMTGAGIGGALAAAVAGPGAATALLALLLAVCGTVGLMALASVFMADPKPSVGHLIAAGESADCEFKSTARHNLHTGLRDDKIELVIAKATSGFLNGTGGTLLIGVADDGTVLGLDADMVHMRSSDPDRYELWLRDYLSRTLGAATTALIQVTFPRVGGELICRIDVRPSPRPVFLRPMRSDSVLFCVRIGNATREMAVDQAITYAADHFPQERERIAARMTRRVAVLTAPD